MDRDANYLAVGAFVLLVIAMGVSFVLWYTEHQDKRQYNRYEIYFQGSVSGLNEGSPVRFLGVNVGRVTRVAVDPQRRDRVQVIAEIETNAPINGRTLASLGLQGVTGLLFIDLEQDRSANVPVTLAQGQEYPVIRSKSSDFDKLLSALPTLAGHADEMIGKLNAALSDRNVQAFTDTLNNVKITSARLSKTMQGVDELVSQLKSTAAEVQATSASIRGISDSAAPDIKEITAKARSATENFAETSRQLDKFIAQNEKGVSRFTDQGLPEFERLLREARDAARDIRELSRSLRQNPSQLIYEPTHRGIEVPR
jgi:phospholipid/cholesterol/gamma-HCH transport system substrate-binding protein